MRCPVAQDRSHGRFRTYEGARASAIGPVGPPSDRSGSEADLQFLHPPLEREPVRHARFEMPDLNQFGVRWPGRSDAAAAAARSRQPARQRCGSCSVAAPSCGRPARRTGALLRWQTRSMAGSIGEIAV
jgi:hypothetical protein